MYCWFHQYKLNFCLSPLGGSETVTKYLFFPKMSIGMLWSNTHIFLSEIIFVIVLNSSIICISSDRNNKRHYSWEKIFTGSRNGLKVAMNNLHLLNIKKTSWNMWKKLYRRKNFSWPPFFPNEFVDVELTKIKICGTNQRKY